MPYNSNTRLLLQFGETYPDVYDVDTSEWQRACTVAGNNASFYINTSPYGSGTGNCLHCGGMAGDYDNIYVNSPSGVFASPSTSTKLFSWWYTVDSDHPDSASGMFNYSASDNSFRIHSENDGRITIIGTNGGTFVAQSATNSANLYGTGWHHLYVYINGTNIKVGLDGSEVINYTHTSDIWGTGATVYEIAFGQAQNYWAHRGYLDSIEVLENDSTWTGGSYTVPGKPSNYLAPGTPINVNLTGQDLTFSQGTPGLSLPVNVSMTGQDMLFSTPKLKVTASPSNKRLWSRQPTKRLRADMLQAMTDGRIGAYDIAREFWETPSPNVYAALSGQSLNFSQGAITASYTGPVSVSINGQLLSMVQGTPKAARSIQLSGTSYAYSNGAIGTNKSVSITGTTITYQQGSTAAGVDKVASVTGQSYSYSQGTLTASQAATYNSNTRLQMRFNEANGSTTTDDSSAYDRTSTFYGPAQIINSPVKFGAGCLELGNPSGTETHSYVSIDSPAGLLSQSTSSAKRFDFWFRRAVGNSATRALLTVHLQNNDNFAIVTEAYNGISAHYEEAYGGQYTYTSGTFSSSWPHTSYHHVRVLVYGNTLTIGADGAQVATITRSGGTDIWRASDIDELLLGSWPSAHAAHTLYFHCGNIDSLVITEGDTSWTGGSYSVPTAEPEDPPAGGGITGDSANTIDDVTSTGNGTLGLMASGENTVDAVTSAGVGVVEKFMVGASTVDAVTTEGVLAKGVVLYAEGANTLEATGNVGTAIMQPTRFLSGANTVEAVTSTGAGYIWANLVGANTTAPVTSTGTGDNTSPLQEIFGEGANTTAAVTSTGSGEAPIVGAGANTTAAVLSAGELFTGAILSGSNTLDPVTSSGIGFVGIRLAQGLNTTGEITSSGTGDLAIYGLGSSDVSVSSIGYAELAIQGSGSNALDDVKTYFPAGYFDHYDVAFTKTQESRVWVR